MVEHDFCETLAKDAPLDPEKVQLVALFPSGSAGGGVTAGAATGSAMGEANVDAANAASKVQRASMTPKKLCVLNNKSWRCSDLEHRSARHFYVQEDRHGLTMEPWWPLVDNRSWTSWHSTTLISGTGIRNPPMEN